MESRVDPAPAPEDTFLDAAGEEVMLARGGDEDPGHALQRISPGEGAGGTEIAAGASPGTVVESRVDLAPSPEDTFFDAAGEEVMLARGGDEDPGHALQRISPGEDAGGSGTAAGASPGAVVESRALIDVHIKLMHSGEFIYHLLTLLLFRYI